MKKRKRLRRASSDYLHGIDVLGAAVRAPRSPAPRAPSRSSSAASYSTSSRVISAAAALPTSSAAGQKVAMTAAQKVAQAVQAKQTAQQKAKEDAQVNQAKAKGQAAAQRAMAAGSKVSGRLPKIGQKVASIGTRFMQKVTSLQGDVIGDLESDLLGVMMANTFISRLAAATRMITQSDEVTAIASVATIADSVNTLLTQLNSYLQQANATPGTTTSMPALASSIPQLNTLITSGTAIVNRCTDVTNNYDPSGGDTSVVGVVNQIQTDANNWTTQAQAAISAAAQAAGAASADTTSAYGGDSGGGGGGGGDDGGGDDGGGDPFGDDGGDSGDGGFPDDGGGDQPDDGSGQGSGDFQNYGNGQGGDFGDAYAGFRRARGFGDNDRGEGLPPDDGGDSGDGADWGAINSELAAPDLDTMDSYPDTEEIADRQIDAAVEGDMARHYVHGIDILGADVIPAAGQTYNDHATVLAVQTALKNKGYDPKGLDGVFGPNTSKAIKAMQSDAGIPQTGVIDSGVLMALGVSAPSSSIVSSSSGSGSAGAYARLAPYAAGAPVPPGGTPGAPVGFWAQPLYQGSPLKRWQGALGLGGLALLGTGIALAVRK
ncbi:MAG TPA: peptidoglycan-binding domain-containing protein [Candidatus Margulisiibacteriota bacterium]|nr:peptidoglycan-binding domain-containing protein [Candidatus Margulisiibacteriota bacterium]